MDVRIEGGQIPTIQGNAADLTQVVSNLIFNAVDAMPEGGRLTLKTFLEENTIILEVSDTGDGMSTEVKEKLFQPFFTTKNNGYGLGTSIIYGIVARHGGEIKVSSEEGIGSTFLLQSSGRERVGVRSTCRKRCARGREQTGEGARRGG